MSCKHMTEDSHIVRRDESGAKIWRCSVCGKEDKWGRDWTWFGSLCCRRCHEGVVTAVFCSDECAKRVGRLAERCEPITIIATEFYDGEWHVPEIEGPDPQAVVTRADNGWHWWARGRVGTATTLPGARSAAEAHLAMDPREPDPVMHAPLSIVTAEGCVKLPQFVRDAIGVPQGGGVVFFKDKDGIRIVSDRTAHEELGWAEDE